MEREKVREILDKVCVHSSITDLKMPSILEWIDEKAIVVPKWHRRYLWDKETADDYIFSVVNNIPTPPMVLFKDKNYNFWVVDGLQRLESLYLYATKKFLKRPPSELVDYPLFSTSMLENKVGKIPELIDIDFPEHSALIESFIRFTIMEEVDGDTPELPGALYMMYNRTMTNWEEPISYVGVNPNEQKQRRVKEVSEGLLWKWASGSSSHYCAR